MVFIIDGNHLACRCFYAVDSLSTSEGKSVNVIYGFISTLKSYVERFGKDNNFLIVWDSRGGTERHEIYPEYKANRKGFPEEFYEQLKDIRRVIKALTIEQFKRNGIEADDLVGTLTYKARKKGQKVTIISSDHDFEQLIRKHVKVLTPSLAFSKESIKDRDYVTRKYSGVQPEQLPDVFAMIGDSGDNIIGIEGIGPKTAARLIKANDSLDNVLNDIKYLKTFDKKGNLKDETDKIKEKIQQNKERLKLNRELVTINCFVDIEPSFRLVKSIDKDKLIQLFKEFEFKKFLKEINQWETTFVN